MLYLHSKYNYDEGSIIDIYVKLDDVNTITNYEAIAAQHLLNVNSAIRQHTKDSVTTETVCFSGGELLFIKRFKETTRNEALLAGSVYDRN